ncbi:unnamed protein product [Rotaria magnacalcarata]|uniref:EF-hand domain-containing protein n=1 Tax=Rotaria magnacalcarata TaxID=392030 RepID=A0A816S7U6_9BILA|nr:unnamed protein product [Rotaria magnacalcarata]CAF1621729.1 unnamed protein product [Rotaria magnacalcarata]CAF2017331.1 unnamed protein product [Rotaria magnacalcarata]CAF2082020.1 unnamed protein product [Rotaria magnacalcarata]CAF2221661.1 unnamed protein product [Rotaria magnacalcarata]
MGANKTKINKTVLHHLVTHTNRSPAEIKAMYAIFCRHFPTGNIESPQDLCRCLQKFSLLPIEYTDQKAFERLYRLFDIQNRNEKHDGSIDFFNFMVVSHILEHGSPMQKIHLYFQSFDVNNDLIITRDDLEACLPPTVESRQLIQQLLRQWDMNRDGVVNLEDFQQFIMTNPDLLSMFTDVKERVRMNSITAESLTDNNQSADIYNINHGTFSKSQ